MTEEAGSQVFGREVVGIRLPESKGPVPISWVTSASQLISLSLSLSCKMGLIIVSTS